MLPIRSALVVSVLTGVTAVVGCGGGSSTQPSQTGVKKLTASINPVPTSANQVVPAASTFTATNVNGALLSTGVLGIAGTNGGLALNINLTNVPGPGTYAIPSASWVDSTGVYVLLNGGSGTITLTTATPARVTGTFAFIANDIPGGNPAQKRVSVTNGSFDISNP